MPCERCAVAAFPCNYPPSTRKSSNTRPRQAKRLRKLDEAHHLHPTSSLNGDTLPPVESASATEHGQEAGTIEDSCFERIFRQNRPQTTTFRGPTSHDFDLGLAKTNLQSQLGTEQHQLTTFECDVPAASEYLVDRLPLAHALLNDPLQDLSLEDCKRLIQLYQNGPGAINPITDTEELMADCAAVFRALETSRTTDSLTTLIKTAEKLSDPAIVTLKLVLANGAVLDSGTADKRFQSLFDSLRKPLSCFFWSLPNLLIIRDCLLLVRDYHDGRFFHALLIL